MNTKKMYLQLTGLLLILLTGPVSAFELSNSKLYWLGNFYEDVKHDYGTYYQKDTLLILGGVLGVAGIMANTDIDHSIYKFWKKNIETKHTHAFFEPANSVGSFNY